MGYKCIPFSRQGGTGGGVALFVPVAVELDLRSDLSSFFSLSQAPNIKKQWEIINYFLHPNKKTGVRNIVPEGNNINDPSEIAELFNKYFVTIGPKLAATIPPTNTPPVPIEPNTSVYLHLTTEDGILEIINGLKKVPLVKTTTVPEY